MTRAAVLAWLDARRPAPPEALRTHLAAAVPETPPAGALGLPDALAVIGATLLGRVTRGGGGVAGRDLALDLLAADAFVTYAFEAQTEVNVDGLAPLADRVGRLVEAR